MCKVLTETERSMCYIITYVNCYSRVQCISFAIFTLVLQLAHFYMGKLELKVKVKCCKNTNINIE